MFGANKTKIITDEDKINEVLTRGVENIYPSVDFLKSKLLKGERVSIYLGIDPTGTSLHLGHVIPLRKLAKFQELGHQIILLMGDFTAMIGDPTDKTAVRKKLTHEEVMENLKEYKKQASKFISFSGENPAQFKFNSEWLGEMKFKDVLEITSLVTVEQMMKRDMFARRSQEGKPTYVHELMYPLMQGYDSVAMNVDGEVGGNDQTFNMLVGRDLMKTLKNKEKFVITTKLLVDSSGGKMGKTEGNMVTLADKPSDMYGKVMSMGDELMIKYFTFCTRVPLTDIKNVEARLKKKENPRDIKMQLARVIVEMYHNKKSASAAEEQFVKIFQKKDAPNEMPEVKPSAYDIVVLLVEAGICKSKGEARRVIDQGGVKINDKKVAAQNYSAMVKKGDIVQKGSRWFVKVK